MKTTEFHVIRIHIKWVKVLLTIVVIIFMQSCKDEDELMLETTTLKGTWVKIEPEDIMQFAGSNHTFTFTEDSFFLAIES